MNDNLFVIHSSGVLQSLPARMEKQHPLKESDQLRSLLEHHVQEQGSMSLE